jgi:hypothetical protein
VILGAWGSMVSWSWSMVSWFWSMVSWFWSMVSWFWSMVSWFWSMVSWFWSMVSWCWSMVSWSWSWSMVSWSWVISRVNSEYFLQCRSMGWFSITRRRVVIPRLGLRSMIRWLWVMLHMVVNVMVFVTMVHHMSHMWILLHVVQWHMQVKH